MQIYPEDTASVDHSHTGMVHSAHFVEADQSRRPRRTTATRWTRKGCYYPGASSKTSTVVSRQCRADHDPTLAQKQTGELVLGHLDCNTIPFLWNYADRFTLFDNFHQTIIGPSTPNAIAMIAGQSGETQWALHPTQFETASGYTVPVTGDAGPHAGSTGSPATRPATPRR